MRQLFEFQSTNLAGRVAKASVFSLATRMVRIGAQAINFIVLARFLAPQDFGLVAMITPFIAIAMVVGNLGLSAATAQAKEITASQASSLFYLGLLWGLAVTGLMLAGSPAIAALYHEPRAAAIAAALSLVFVLTSVSAQHQALLERSLRFRSIFFSELAASTGAFVASLLLLFTGAGYWAIVVRLVLHPALYSVVIWIQTGWIPSRPEWSPATRGLMRYGGYSLGFNMLNTTGRQLDNVLIGWRWGELALGPYALAYRLFFLPVQQITHPLGHVMIPALAHLRDDPDRYRRWYTGVLRLICYAAMPPLIAVSICAHDVVYLLAGPQWRAAGDILRWLAPIGALHIAYTSIGWLMLSTGRADRYFSWAVIAVPVYIASFVAGLPWGAEGVAIAYCGANLLLFGPGVVWSCKGTAVSPGSVGAAMMPAMAASAATAAVTFAITHWLSGTTPIWRLIAVGSTVSLGLAGGAFLVFGRLAVQQAVVRVRALLPSKARIIPGEG
jgi:polysaccharide transporter, PST family